MRQYTRRPAASLVLGLVAAALIAAGCGFEDPYASPEPTRNREAPPTAVRVGTDSPNLLGGADSPEAAARTTALAAGNWTKETVEDGFRNAAALSVDGANVYFRRQEAEMLLGVEQAPDDIRSHTEVEAVVVRGSGEVRRAIVVTRESVTGGEVVGEGLQYNVTLAELQLIGGDWMVSEWSPQP